jgi:uroporphyrinogen-III synthase
MESKSQVELLHEISNIVSSNLSLEKMLQELIGLAVNVTDCDACLVYLVDKGRKEIVLRASQLPHAKEIGYIKLKMGEGITGWVTQNKSVVALGANASADSRFKSFQKLQEDTFQAFLSVPLISEGELTGVINIHHKTEHAHTQDEIALVTFLGEQMGALSPSAKLAERSERATRRMEAAGRTRRQTHRDQLPRPILQTIAEMVAR